MNQQLLTYTYAQDWARAQETIAMSKVAGTNYLALQRYDRGLWEYLEDKQGKDVVYTDFPRGGNLNGKEFIERSLTLYQQLFDKGHDVLIKRDSDMILLNPGHLLAVDSTEPLFNYYLAGRRIGGGVWQVNAPGLSLMRQAWDLSKDKWEELFPRPTGEPPFPEDLTMGRLQDMQDIGQSAVGMQWVRENSVVQPWAQVLHLARGPMPAGL